MNTISGGDKKLQFMKIDFLILIKKLFRSKPVNNISNYCIDNVW
jgi:hypothetical protein